jgi:hypothetical protein
MFVQRSMIVTYVRNLLRALSSQCFEGLWLLHRFYVFVVVGSRSEESQASIRSVQATGVHIIKREKEEAKSSAQSTDGHRLLFRPQVWPSVLQPLLLPQVWLSALQHPLQLPREREPWARTENQRRLGPSTEEEGRWGRPR